MLSSSAPYLAVMDADLQHDEMLLPKFLDAAKHGGADVVVASRYMEGGSTGELAAEPVGVSRLASALSSVLCEGLRRDERFLRGAQVFSSSAWCASSTVGASRSCST